MQVQRMRFKQGFRKLATGVLRICQWISPANAKDDSTGNSHTHSHSYCNPHRKSQYDTYRSESSRVRDRFSTLRPRFCRIREEKLKDCTSSFSSFKLFIYAPTQVMLRRYSCPRRRRRSGLKKGSFLLKLVRNKLRGK
jgi:hypothetical protein